jgi:hypothetical protein
MASPEGIPHFCVAAIEGKEGKSCRSDKSIMKEALSTV